MSVSRQFLRQPATDQELLELLERAKASTITEEQLHEQRVSFAFGNAPDSDYITKDSVRHAAKHVRLNT